MLELRYFVYFCLRVHCYCRAKSLFYGNGYQFPFQYQAAISSRKKKKKPLQRGQADNGNGFLAPGSDKIVFFYAFLFLYTFMYKINCLIRCPIKRLTHTLSYEYLNQVADHQSCSGNSSQFVSELKHRQTLSSRQKNHDREYMM